MTSEIIILAVTGLVGGFIGGQVGGGSLITLPALFFFGLPPALAIGTNVIAGWIINVIAVAEYWKGARVKLLRVLPLAILSFLGSLLGARLVLSVGQEVLAKIIAVLFVGLIILVFAEPREGKRDGKQKMTPELWAVAGAGSFFLGIYGGFFGASVTTLFIFLFTYLIGRSLLHAVADALLIAAILHVGAFAVFALEGNIIYSFAMPLAIGAGLGSYIGARVALKFGAKWLRWLLVAVVLVLVTKLFLGV